MTILIIFVQLLLSIPLFFLINWIGHNTSNTGYIYFTLMYKGDERPGFNFVLRVFTPVIYIILISAILKEFGYDIFTINIYFITLYYFIFRWLFICLSKDMFKLYDWRNQIIYLMFSFTFSYFIYKKFLLNNISLLPDLKELTNAIWISICVFIYYISNQVKLPYKSSINRRNKYFIDRYNKFSKKFDKYIPTYLPSDLKILVYSIMIVENYNRPFLVRLLEYTAFFISRKEKSMGIMQVKSKKYISSKNSIKLACEKIYKDFLASQGDILATIYKYNPSTDYVNNVATIFDFLLKQTSSKTT